MTAPLNALQAAIYTRLVAETGANVYDHVPQGTNPPYIVIGDDTFNEDDTKTSNGWDCTITIHSWDFLKAGRKSVKALMGQIYDALHRQEDQITIDGFALLEMHCEFQQTFQEQEDVAPDHYYHGVQRFRALITDTNL